MSDGTPGQKPTNSAQILDLLLDALLERQAARQAQHPEQRSEMEQPAPSSVTRALRLASSSVRQASRPQRAREPGPGEEGWEPPARVPSMNLDKALGRFLLLVAALIVLVNVPINRYGVSLARMIPESASLIIRDGLVLKGSGPEIYILQDNKLRWISSLDAFEHLGLNWGDVHIVDDAFLSRFENGQPIHVLLKCEDSPHIYRLENGEKRWIKDIATFEAEGHVWEDVRLVSCDYLRSIPDGPPIPTDAGPPPQP
jgi:hypothetical protein